MTDGASILQLGQGLYWQEMPVGQKFRTFRRTITEADLVAFISVTGMLEQIFIDAEHGGAMGARPVPAALTQAFIEGMQMQTLVQGTGVALLEMATKTIAPTRVGDTIWATVEIAEVRPTSKSGRAVVVFDVRVFNQRDEPVLSYVVKRLIAGRPER
jgi:acyl dehydratase